MDLKNKENCIIKNNNWIQITYQWIFSFISSITFLLLYSNTTSPLTNYFGEDSAYYALVGSAMRQGLLPYRDFYEMKGPYMYWIEFLGRMIFDGRFGTFCIQVVNMTLTIGIFISIINLALQKKNMKFIKKLCIHIISVAYILFIISLTFEGGNLTEEFSYPVLAFCLYLCVKYLLGQKESDDSDHKVKYGFVYGLAFGFFAFVRIINAAFIGAILLTITIYLITKKNWMNLLKNALAFIVGTLVALIPGSIWAIGHGIFKDMINQVYILAFSYSTEYDLQTRLIAIKLFIWPMILIACIPIFVLFIYMKKDWKLFLLSISSAIILFIAVSMGDGYLHYFSLQLPNAMLGLYLFILCWQEENISKKNIYIGKIILSVFVIGICILLQKETIEARTIFIAKDSIKNVLNDKPEDLDVPYIKDIVEKIPESDQDSLYLYGFESCSQWYAKAGLFPANKYCDWQLHWIVLYPEIEGEIKDALSTKEIKWVLLPTGQTVWPESIHQTIYEKYEEYYINDLYTLLKCKE